MLPLAIGAAIMGGAQLAGTGMQMYGQQRQQKATERALRAYQQAADAHFADEQAALQQNMREAHGERMNRLGSISQYLDDFRRMPAASTEAAPGPADLGPQRIGGWQNGMQGSAGTQAQAQQDVMTQDANAALSKQLIAQWRQRQEQLQADENQAKFNMREMLTRARRGDLSERQQLSAALRQLAWQRQQIQLQSALNAAQKAGGGEMMAGQLLGAGGSAIGSGLMAYGAGGGAGGGRAASPSFVPDTNAAYTGGMGYDAYYNPNLSPGAQMA
jgi:hypothetical protein